MNKFVLGLSLSLVFSGQVLAQSTPTPIQKRVPSTKTEALPPPANSVTVIATPKPEQKDNAFSYCANSMRVFRGIGTYNPEFNQYSVNFKFKLCFTNSNELYTINRIFLLPTNYSDYSQYFWTSIVNQPIRVVLRDYRIIRIGDKDEIIATRFDIVKDD